MIQLPVSASEEPFHGNYGGRDLETLKLGPCQRALSIRISRSGKFHALCTLSQVCVIFRFLSPDVDNFTEIRLVSSCFFFYFFPPDLSAR